MSEEKKKDRSIEQVQSDYQGMCLKAGHIQYQIFALQKDLGLLNEAIKDLNLEAASVKSKEAEGAKSE